MKKSFAIVMILLLCMMGMVVLTGCDDSPVAGMIVSEERFENEEAIGKAVQPASLAAGSDIYASVLFIESPKGMRYTAKWLLNGTEIKTEEKEMTTDKKGLILFALEKDLADAGTLTLQIVYKDEVLAQKDITVQ